MSPFWTIVPAGPVPGDRGQLLVVDREDAPDGRTVCVVPGSLDWRAAEGVFVRLLDEQDIGNARLIVAAPLMRTALADLLEWQARTGVWDSPCWERAHAVIATPREPPP